MTDSDMRTFLALTTRWMDERYEQVWNELGAQPGSEDGPELPDLFHRAVDGLEPLDYHWILQAAVVRDAVSAFEVYLEKVAAEVLQRHGYIWQVQPGRTPTWPDTISFFSNQLDIEVNTDRVQHVRGLRHMLTHLRGELRSPQQREQFGRNGDGGLSSCRAELSVNAVVSALDDLAEMVRRVDPVAWPFTYGDRHLELG
jgi:hypothetical protein